MRLTGERERVENRIADIKKTRANYEKGLNQVKRELEAKGKTTSKGLVKRQDEINELGRDISTLEAEKAALNDKIKSLKTPPKVEKGKTPELEEGNWGSEFRRDIGHENTTLRNRVIDSEFVVRERTKYKSPIRVHYVEPVKEVTETAPKMPVAKAVYEPAVIDNEEQLLNSLVALQGMIAKTPHRSLYDRINKFVTQIEKSYLRPVDPGVDNRTFDTDMLGSPYSQKEFKASADTVEKRKLQPKQVTDAPKRLATIDKELKGLGTFLEQLKEQLPKDLARIKLNDARMAKLDELEARLDGIRAGKEDMKTPLGKVLGKIPSIKKALNEAKAARAEVRIATERSIAEAHEGSFEYFINRARKAIEKIETLKEERKTLAALPAPKENQPGFTIVGRDEAPLQLNTKDPDADFVGRDYSTTTPPKPWQKRTTPDEIDRYRELEKQTNEYLAALSKNKKVPVQLKVGTPTASLFKSRAAAVNYGVNVYGLDPKRFNVFQQGNGYYISISKIVDETEPSIRDLALVNNKADEGDG